MNENLVRWYLFKGGFPFPSVMVEAARRAPLRILKILIEHGGKVEDSELVAEAAQGDWWGYPDRIDVINYLLDLGAPIERGIGCSWPPNKPYFLLRGRTSLFEGEKTAYQIARLTPNNELAELLSQRGAKANVPTPDCSDCNGQTTA
jgi:hypothetical protein